MTKTDLREALAALEHDRWSRWEEYREQALNSDASGVESTWRRKRDQAYSELTEHEKDPDRAEAHRTLEIVWPLIERLELTQKALGTALDALDKAVDVVRGRMRSQDEENP